METVLVENGQKRLWRALLAATAIVALALMRMPSAGAAPQPAGTPNVLTVNTVEDSDDGVCAPLTALTDCTLREAINAANLSPGTISFDLPGAAPHTIDVLSALPDIGSGVVVDGTTQPDFAGHPVVELVGPGGDQAFNGLRLLNAQGSTVRGLVLGQFGYAIVVQGGSGNRVEGNYVGTDSTGTEARRNVVGVKVTSADDTVIGGTAAGAGNVISGNLFGIATGITSQFSPYSNGTQIEGNLIGTDATGTRALGNGSGLQISGDDGVTIGGSSAAAGNVISANNYGLTLGYSSSVVQSNLIGTDATGTIALGNTQAGIAIGGSPTSVPSSMIGGRAGTGANTIANNGAGILVSSPANASILSNSIYGNGPTELGIDLVENRRGVTVNDHGDADDGANGLQNYPDISSVRPAGTGTVVDGTLDSHPSSTYLVQLFANPTCHSSGHGEGKRYLGEVDVTTDADGSASFSDTLTFALAASDVVTATATDAAGNTSEFSACAQLQNQPPRADAGPDQTVDSSADFFLDAAASSDPDGQPLTYQWEQIGGPAAVIADPRSARTQVKGVTGAATLTFRLTVTDASGATGTDDITVSVRPK
ncbi:MAG: CSLREA domain-containing protein [Actinomycetota bacterium]|nr:CSLREA domain-containing protein [Actinomycetota bacterium]